MFDLDSYMELLSPLLDDEVDWVSKMIPEFTIKSYSLAIASSSPRPSFYPPLEESVVFLERMFKKVSVETSAIFALRVFEQLITEWSH